MLYTYRSFIRVIIYIMYIGVPIGCFVYPHPARKLVRYSNISILIILVYIEYVPI